MHIYLVKKDTNMMNDHGQENALPSLTYYIIYEG